MNTLPYDAILLVSFGGPECSDDVVPFLENVLRGKNVPHARMLEVVQHYQQFGGVSPINSQNRQIIADLKNELAEYQIDLPIYWGNRNWHPLLPDTLQQMQQDGIQRVLTFFTSMYNCYSGCRQYRENITDAQATLAEPIPTIDKLRIGFNHPLYIEASAEQISIELSQIFAERRPKTQILFTAHSIPISMSSGSDYVDQLNESCRLIMSEIGEQPWSLVYQSRSGPASQPWLEPDVCDTLQNLKQSTDIEDVILFPVGFISDHMEVLFDLDTEAKEICEQIGVNMRRAKTVGTHPKFISMIRELIQERISAAPRRSMGNMPLDGDTCPADCCTYQPQRPKQV